MAQGSRTRPGSALPSREPPPVTVTGAPSASPAPVDPPARGGGPGPAALVLGALALVAAAVLVGRPPPPPPPPPLDAELRLLGDDLANSQSGVLVLPVEVVNRGPAVAVTDRVVWAEPVRQEPASEGRRRIESGATGRVVVLVQPDCALLAPGQGFSFAATLVLSLRDDVGQQVDASLDLGREPAVVERVAGLCRAPV
jgi:hypothetical protein